MNAQSQTEILELLRHRYERDGYTVTLSPPPEALPQFMSGYQPDAIAQKGNACIAIEIKTRRDTAAAKLKDVAARFKNQPNWRLNVVVAEDFEPEPISAPERAEVLSRLTVVEAMAASDNADAALVLAWAALEAAARFVAREAGEAIPKSPREALQLLEYLGRIDFQTAQAMRHTLDLRNQVVHGDLRAVVPPGTVSNLLDAVRSALAA